jgi:hypothetical protein
MPPPGTPLTLLLILPGLLLAGCSASPTTCDPSAPFLAVLRVPGLESTDYLAMSAGLSADERTAVFLSFTGAGPLWIADRASRRDPFGPARPLPDLSALSPGRPALSADGLTLYFYASAGGSADLYVSTRASRLQDFTTASPIAGLDQATVDELDPYPVPDGLYYVRDSQVWRAPRTGAGPADFGASAQLPELAAAALWNNGPVVSQDELTIYLASVPALGSGYRLRTAHRAKVTDPFPALTDVVGAMSDAFDLPTFVSADGCRLYLSSNRGDLQTRVWVAERHP